ncbi:MAG: hypothetical protein ABI196_15180 [Bradyrhizobium sp.]
MEPDQNGSHAGHHSREGQHPNRPTDSKTAEGAEDPSRWPSSLSDAQLAELAGLRNPPPLGEARYRHLATVFFCVSFALFLAIPILMWIAMPIWKSLAAGELPGVSQFILMVPLIALITAGVFCAIMGYLLISAAGAETRRVLPRQDAFLLNQLLMHEKEKGIDQYILLSSLSGITGVFTKIGFTGLPLATMALTLILIALSIYNEKFLQMAQLTLGAFIGSFVERRQTLPPRESAKPVAGA